MFVEDRCNLVLEIIDSQSAGLERLSRCCMDILPLYTELRGYTINIICQQDAMRKRYPVVTRLSLYQIGVRIDRLLTAGFLHKINILFSYAKKTQATTNTRSSGPLRCTHAQSSTQDVLRHHSPRVVCLHLLHSFAVHVVVNVNVSDITILIAACLRAKEDGCRASKGYDD